MPSAPAPFRLGVNYWPAALAMDWLRVYDPGVTRRDFVRAKSSGFDTVRVFLRWEDAQPGRSTMDTPVLGRLVDAADAAVEAGITLLVTLFTGHMSGVNWAPGWAVGGGAGDQRFRIVSGGNALPPETGLRNWYHDPSIAEAQERLAVAAANALAGHPGVWGWDLGNENSNCTVPSNRAAGEAWLDRMSTAVRNSDPGRPVTIGLHMEDIENDRMIGPAEAARYCDIVSMHGYPIYADWAAGPTDHELVPFLAVITRWLGSGCAVLFAEFGLPTAPVARPERGLVDESAAAGYTGRALDGLRSVGCVGAFLWCFSDYDPKLASTPPFDAAPHELSFGLWRADGTPKPAVAEVSSRAHAACIEPRTPGGWLDIEPATFVEDRHRHLRRLYTRFRAAGEIHPPLTTRSIDAPRSA
jgi:endo-1,4-beta-mannosidase